MRATPLLNNLMFLKEKESVLYLSEKILLEQSHSNYFILSLSVDTLSKSPGDAYDDSGSDSAKRAIQSVQRQETQYLKKFQGRK